MTSTTLTLPAPMSLGRSVAHGEDGRCAEYDDQHDEHGRHDEHAAAGLRHRWGTVVEQGTDAGMATAEYAIAMIAAVGFAGLLVTVLSSGTVRSLLTGLVTSALSIG
jgi:hypothetical protein